MDLGYALATRIPSLKQRVALLGAIALRELARGRANGNEAALLDSSNSQWISPRLLSRGPHGHEGLQALRTVRPDKVPSAIFHGG